MARLRLQIPAVTAALRKSQQRYKRNIDANISTRNDHVNVGDYVYTTNHNRAHKMLPKTVGPFLVVDADAPTLVVDIDGQETRIISDYATPAPRPPDVTDATRHALLDGLDKPRLEVNAQDEYVIDKLITCRKFDQTYKFKIRWYDYIVKDDMWEPVESLPRNMVIRYLRTKKIEIPRYNWRKVTSPTQVNVCANTDNMTLVKKWTPII